jgi:hypothetical protein
LFIVAMHISNRLDESAERRVVWQSKGRAANQGLQRAEPFD